MWLRLVSLLTLGETQSREQSIIGWAVFSEVSLYHLLLQEFNAFTGSDLSVPEGTFTPELASLLTTVFTTIFGRRLGTVDDGTTLRATPQVGSDAILSNGESELTLSRINTIHVGTIRANANLGSGSTLDNLAKYVSVEPIGSELRTRTLSRQKNI